MAASGLPARERIATVLQSDPFSLAAGKLSRGGSRCAADLPLTPGRIAIDGSGKAIWLWAGDKVQVSTDRGRTWEAR